MASTDKYWDGTLVPWLHEVIVVSYHVYFLMNHGGPKTVSPTIDAYRLNKTPFSYVFWSCHMYQLWIIGRCRLRRLGLYFYHYQICKNFKNTVTPPDFSECLYAEMWFFRKFPDFRKFWKFSPVRKKSKHIFIRKYQSISGNVDQTESHLCNAPAYHMPAVLG